MMFTPLLHLQVVNRLEMGKVLLINMVSYGVTTPNVDNMNVKSFMDSDYNNYFSEVNQSEYHTASGNSDSTHLKIFHNLHHNNEEGIWLQNTAFSSESQMTAKQQLEFPVSACDYTGTASNAKHVTSYKEFETQEFIQSYNTPKDNTPQLLHEKQQHTQPIYYHQRPETYQRNKGIGKFQRAYCISFIRTSEGNFEAVLKRKRRRTVFTTEQIEVLEEYFCRQQYVTRLERQKLVNKLKLNDKAVKIWFQNRRLKGKRDQESQESADSFVINSETLHPCLDYVESQINERTDELGYVTLDDTLTGNLVNVIDTVLANRNCIDLPSEESTTQTECSPIYEPISPAEVSCPDWELSEHKETSQRFFDLQSILSI